MRSTREDTNKKGSSLALPPLQMIPAGAPILHAGREDLRIAYFKPAM
jgi:hypothetical protein